VKTSLAKSSVFLAAFFSVLSGLLTSGVSARELTDALGTQVKVADHPIRVITLAPSLGELASDLLGDKIDRIVGVSDYTDYPPALSKVKNVGSYARFNLESVVALKPDLVLATSDGNSRDQIDHLRELHLPVVVVKTSSFSEIDQSIEILAKALDEEKTGDALRKRLKEGLEHIEAHADARRREGKPAPSVLLELDSNPLVVAGNATFLNEALQKVGAKNIYADVHKPYPKPLMEDVIRRNPDVILLLAMDRNLKTFEQAAKDWKRFSKMKAVQAGKIKVMHADTIIRPSLRILEGLSLLEQAIYGK
jgi:iron complex transport system substrate-binding protein